MNKRYKVRDENTTIVTDKVFRVLAAAGLIISLVAGFNLLSILCVCILALSVGTKLWAGAGLNHLEVRFGLDGSRAFPDEPIVVSLVIENRKILPVSLKAELYSSVGGSHQIESALLSYGNLKCDWSLTFDKRGVYNLGPLRVSAYDLLGFYSVEETFAQPREVIIYPQLLNLKKYFPTSREYFGNYKSLAFVEDPVLIEGTRDYAYQSPARNIHWKSTARTMILQEKIYTSTAHLKVMICIDTEGFNKEGAVEEFEIMLRTAASVAVVLSRNNIQPGLMVNGIMHGDQIHLLPHGEGTSNIHILLEKLARLSMDFNPDYEQSIQQHSLNGNISYIYFCYAVDEKVKQLVSKAKAADIITWQEFVSMSEMNRVRVYNIDECIDVIKTGDMNE